MSATPKIDAATAFAKREAELKAKHDNDIVIGEWDATLDGLAASRLRSVSNFTAATAVPSKPVIPPVIPPLAIDKVQSASRASIASSTDRSGASSAASTADLDSLPSSQRAHSTTAENPLLALAPAFKAAINECVTSEANTQLMLDGKVKLLEGVHTLVSATTKDTVLIKAENDKIKAHEAAISLLATNKELAKGKFVDAERVLFENLLNLEAPEQKAYFPEFMKRLGASCNYFLLHRVSCHYERVQKEGHDDPKMPTCRDHVTQTLFRLLDAACKTKELQDKEKGPLEAKMGDILFVVQLTEVQRYQALLLKKPPVEKGVIDKEKAALFQRIYDELSLSLIQLKDRKPVQAHLEKLLAALGTELALEFMGFVIDTDMPKQGPDDILRKKEVSTRLYYAIVADKFETELQEKVIQPIIEEMQKPECEFGKLKTLPITQAAVGAIDQSRRASQAKEKEETPFQKIERAAAHFCEKQFMAFVAVISKSKDPVIHFIHERLYQAAKKLFEVKPSKAQNDPNVTAEIAAKGFISSAIFLRIISPALVEIGVQFHRDSKKSAEDNLKLVVKALQIIANGKTKTEEKHMNFASDLAKRHAELTLYLSHILRGPENVAVDELASDKISPRWWSKNKQVLEQQKVHIKKRLTTIQAAKFDSLITAK